MWDCKLSSKVYQVMLFFCIIDKLQSAVFQSESIFKLSRFNYQISIFKKYWGVSKCNFNKVFMQLYWNCTLARVSSCKLLHIFRTPFLKITFARLQSAISIKEIYSNLTSAWVFSFKFALNIPVRLNIPWCTS